MVKKMVKKTTGRKVAKLAKSTKKKVASKKTGSTPNLKKLAKPAKSTPKPKGKSNNPKNSKSTALPKVDGAAAEQILPFTMEDATKLIQVQKSEAKEHRTKSGKKKTVKKVLKKSKVRRRQAASIADILGHSPSISKSRKQLGKPVPRKWASYHKALMALRDRVTGGIQLHSSEILRRANHDEAVDASEYRQDAADAGSEAFERDLALNMISNEQEFLSEIDAAIDRIHGGKYGVCEITKRPIKKERLKAVPFARYSVQGQRKLEDQRKQKNSRANQFVSTEDVFDLSTGNPDE